MQLLKLLESLQVSLTFNKASMKALEKNGYYLESIRKKSVIKNGQIIDDYIWVKLKGWREEQWTDNGIGKRRAEVVELGICNSIELLR